MPSTKILVIIVAVIITVTALSIFSIRTLSTQSQPKLKLGIQANGQLQTCPGSPNCVSSFVDSSDKEHYILPTELQGKSWLETKNQIKEYLDSEKSYKMQNESENYLYYTQKSQLLGFIDDVEVLFLPQTNQIHFRSSSRLGYSDMSVNRRRVEEIKTQIK